MMMNNRIKNAFDKVRAEDELKRNTKDFLSARAARTVSLQRFQRTAVAFACLALVMLSFGGWRFYMTPVSAVSIDVNPSVELGINLFDRVVAVEGYNDEGIDLAESVNLKNLNYSDAIETLLASETMQSYVAEDGLVSITMIGSDDRKSEEMISRIRSCSYAGSPDVECHKGNRAEVKAAHKAGMSFGKYRAFLELKDFDPEITADDVQGLTMRQIRDRINEKSCNSDDHSGTNGNKGHRSGGNGGGN
jgi:hypothetical protein